jgi:hypothetical protein
MVDKSVNHLSYVSRFCRTFAVEIRKQTFKNAKDMSKIALGTWAWGAGA